MKKTPIFALAFVIPAAFAAAGVWDVAELRGKTDSDPVGYAVGQKMKFSISLVGADAAEIPEDAKVKWRRRGDDGVDFSGEAPASAVAAEPIEIETSLDRPGFVRVSAEVVEPDGTKARRLPPEGKDKGESVSFEGGAGAAVAELRAGPEPADFVEYWKRQKEILAAVPVTAERVEIESRDPAVRQYAVSVACAGKRPVTGILSIPVAADRGEKFPAEVTFHGYGTHVQRTSWVSHRAILFNVNAHGYDLLRDDQYYEDFFASIRTEKDGKKYNYAFDPDQNASPDTAYFHDMALRVVRAFDYVRTLPEWDGKGLIASGGSQGGLQTMWAAGLVDGLVEARPGITWCCDFAGLRDGRLKGGWHIPYSPAMEYFDPVHHAAHVPPTCKVDIVRAGLGDYTCPRSGLAVLYNSLPGPKKIHWVQGSTHGYVPKFEENQVVDLSSGWPAADGAAE